MADELALRLDNPAELDLRNAFASSGLSRGEFIYQSARKVVGAQTQVIT